MRAVLIAGALFTVTGAAPAQTIHKCVSKDGRTTYSESPCPGSTVISGAGAAGGTLDPDTMTLSQADLASDCLEVQFLHEEAGWQDKARERAEFDRYCPAFGYRAPMGDANREFNKRHGEELVRKLRMRFPDVPSGARTYSGGRRMPPLFLDAAQVMREVPVRRRNDIDVTKLPALRAGLWQSEVTSDGRSEEQEICGDPLENLRSDLLRYERDTAGMGCVARTISNSPRSVTYVTECAADRSEGGRTVTKGRAEVTIAAASMESATITIRSPRGNKLARLTRAGDCPR